MKNLNFFFKFILTNKKKSLFDTFILNLKPFTLEIIDINDLNLTLGSMKIWYLHFTFNEKNVHLLKLKHLLWIL